MPRIVRGQVALEVGERLTALGNKALRLGEFSGRALEQQLNLLDSAIASELSRMELLIKSCRGAKNSYPNYPTIRRVIAEAGDQIYELKERLEKTRMGFNLPIDEKTLGSELLTIGMELKLVNFVPPSGEEVKA